MQPPAQKFLPKHGLKRADIFLTTKLWPFAEDHAQKTQQAVQESLRNLKTDYLDLVLIHYPKSDQRENEDPLNAQDRKLLWLELEKIHSEWGGFLPFMVLPPPSDLLP